MKIFNQLKTFFSTEVKTTEVEVKETDVVVSPVETNSATADEVEMAVSDVASELTDAQRTLRGWYLLGSLQQEMMRERQAQKAKILQDLNMTQEEFELSAKKNKEKVEYLANNYSLTEIRKMGETNSLPDGHLMPFNAEGRRIILPKGQKAKPVAVIKPRVS